MHHRYHRTWEMTFGKVIRRVPERRTKVTMSPVIPLLFPWLSFPHHSPPQSPSFSNACGSGCCSSGSTPPPPGSSPALTSRLPCQFLFFPLTHAILDRPLSEVKPPRSEVDSQLPGGHGRLMGGLLLTSWEEHLPPLPMIIIWVQNQNNI